MRSAIVALLISLTLTAVSQDRNPDVVRRSGSTPQWDKGRVEGRIYRNASVGVELTPPPGLEFVGDPELKERNPGTLPLLVTITAASEPIPFTARKVLSFYTDALAYYPSTRRTTDAYMLRIAVNQRSDGYELVGGTPQGNLGGVVFERQDFKKGAIYESVFVKACDTQALVFIFAAADEETVNKLSAATELKLDPATSGCLSSAPVTLDKPPNSSPSTASVGVSNGQVYRVSPDVKPPRVVFNPHPSYSQEASKGHAAGEIVIGMVVGSDGQPRDVKVISGISPELDAAAVDAAEQWRFQPGTKDGKPVSVKIALEFDFKP